MPRDSSNPCTSVPLEGAGKTTFAPSSFAYPTAALSSIPIYRPRLFAVDPDAGMLRGGRRCWNASPNRRQKRLRFLRPLSQAGRILALLRLREETASGYTFLSLDSHPDLGLLTHP